MIVYCDMDGVLADFGTPAGEVLGMDFSKGFLKVDIRDWKKLQTEWPTFWLDLELMPHALDLWRALQPWHPSILTAIPNVWKSAATGKEVWAKRMLPKFGYHPSQKLHAVEREDKRKYATTNGRPNVLIDDLDRNVAEWEAAGGIGILYRPSVSMVTQIVDTLRNIN